ncbi:MAG: hypothetical protein ACYDCT_06305 [Dehalococcoidia bacterium]
MDRKILIGSALLLAIAAAEFGLLGAGAVGLTGGSHGPAGERTQQTATPTLTATPASPPPCDNSGSPPCLAPPLPPPCDAGVSPPPLSPPPASPPCSPMLPAHSVELSTDPGEISCDGAARSKILVRLRTRSGAPVADGTQVLFWVRRGGYGVAEPGATRTQDGIAATAVRLGPAPWASGFDVGVHSGPIEATIRVFCAPPSPPSPPCWPSSTPVSPPCAPPTLPPCSPSPPASSPPCAPPTPTPTPLPCTPGGPTAVSPPQCPVSPPPGPSIGGRISIGTPTLSGGNIVVPVLTSASQDPYRAFNISLSFDNSLLSFTQGTPGGALETSGQQTFCVPGTVLHGRASFGCAALGSIGTTSAGTLANLTFARKATTGCVTLHLFTYGPPDGGNSTTGTFTVSGSLPGSAIVQQNTYDPDVSVDLADGSTGCAGPAATPTPTATGTPRAWTATPTMTATSTAVPTATSTPAAAATATVAAGERRGGRPRGGD